MKLYSGTIFWIEGDFRKGLLGNTYAKADVSRAILDDNILKINHEYNSDVESGLTVLRTKDGYHYDGSMTYLDEQKYSAVVNLKLFSNKNQVLLIGCSIEDGIKYDCIVELNEVI
ncbi:hypothetical protein [Flagellimonas sp.]|uniref:hypothetical protein n=1 Tax=Flagellimonas sp. TaxID=2058762 RepID=UPI003BAD2D91